MGGERKRGGQMRDYPTMTVLYNQKCLKCGVIEEKMVKITAFVMCDNCTVEEFNTVNPASEEKEKYFKWLKIHREKLEEETE